MLGPGVATSATQARQNSSHVSMGNIEIGDIETGYVGMGDIEWPHDRYRSSIAIAVASPPPMQRLATPRFFPCLRSAPSSVTTIRAPDAPIGWPSAQAPPWT